MGLFDKIKGVIGQFTQMEEERKQKEEEERRKREEERKQKEEEERRKREEAARFNPEGKSLEWFSSEDGIKVFKEYMTPQNYILEETAKAEHERKHSDVSFDIYVEVYHKGAKLPSFYFENLVKNIDAQALDYVGPIDLVSKALAIQARPFYIDADGEPQTKAACFAPEVIVSVEKNPVLNFVSNFNCFELKDDVQGSWKDKYNLWSDILVWLGIYGDAEEDVIANNQWIFSKDTYFNDLGTVRKSKGFYKKCIELASQKEYFESKLSECE